MPYPMLCDHALEAEARRLSREIAEREALVVELSGVVGELVRREMAEAPGVRGFGTALSVGGVVGVRDGGVASTLREG